jgi:hypothetical protein
MHRKIEVSPIVLDKISKTQYDLVIGTIGYEKRAKYIFETLNIPSKTSAAIGFNQNKVLNYKKNLHWYLAHKFNIYEPSEEEYPDVVDELVLQISKNRNEQARICIDISSVSRYRIAILIKKLHQLPYPIEVDFLYSFCNFYKQTSAEGPIMHSGPVIPYFAGWTDCPHKGSVLIIGIGFEGKKAMGVWEYLESQKIYAFVPIGHGDKFDDVIARNNSFLFSQMERTNQSSQIFNYIFDEPFNLFLNIESLSSGLASDSRIVILPLGPKIFALAAMLAAQINYPKITVWRVSSGQKEKPIDKIPRGIIVGLKIIYS